MLIGAVILLAPLLLLLPRGGGRRFNALQWCLLVSFLIHGALMTGTGLLGLSRGPGKDADGEPRFAEVPIALDARTEVREAEVQSAVRRQAAASDLATPALAAGEVRRAEVVAPLAEAAGAPTTAVPTQIPRVDAGPSPLDVAPAPRPPAFVGPVVAAPSPSPVAPAVAWVPPMADVPAPMVPIAPQVEASPLVDLGHTPAQKVDDTAQAGTAANVAAAVGPAAPVSESLANAVPVRPVVPAAPPDGRPQAVEALPVAPPAVDLARPPGAALRADERSVPPPDAGAAAGLTRQHTPGDAEAPARAVEVTLPTAASTEAADSSLLVAPPAAVRPTVPPAVPNAVNTARVTPPPDALSLDVVPPGADAARRPAARDVDPGGSDAPAATDSAFAIDRQADVAGAEFPRGATVSVAPTLARGAEPSLAVGPVPMVRATAPQAVASAAPLAAPLLPAGLAVEPAIAMPRAVAAVAPVPLPVVRGVPAVAPPGGAGPQASMAGAMGGAGAIGPGAAGIGRTTPPVGSPRVPAPVMPPPPVSPPAVKLPEWLSHRPAEVRRPIVEKLGGNRESEQAVERGLAYLAGQQEPDGRWTHVEGDDSKPGRRPLHPHDMAYTGLSLLAFLAVDHSPAKDSPYRQAVANGLEYLLLQQGADGDLRGPKQFRGGGSDRANLYDHAIATMALAEAALMTGDRRYAAAAFRAADFSLAAQHPQTGGWRYAPADPGDTSVFGWQLLALHGCEQLGYRVPPANKALAAAYLRSVSRGKSGGLASYQPTRGEDAVMTAEGLFCRMLLDQPIGDDLAREASQYVTARTPRRGEPPNLYFWYYASLSLAQVRNDAWRQWNTQTRDVLIATQHKNGTAAGSWTSPSHYDNGGRAYCTALATLTLEVYYRYLPLHPENVGKGNALPAPARRTVLEPN